MEEMGKSEKNKSRLNMPIIHPYRMNHLHSTLFYGPLYKAFSMKLHKSIKHNNISFFLYKYYWYKLLILS